MTELTKEQREALRRAAGILERRGAYGDDFCSSTLRSILAACPEQSTEPSLAVLLLRRARDERRQMQPADIPEGCTPADARKLREANQQMADEVHGLREHLKSSRAAALEEARAAIDRCIVMGPLPEPAHSERNGLVLAHNEVVALAKSQGNRSPISGNQKEQY